MLEGHSRPVKRPVNEGGGSEDNNGVSQDNAPIRENPLIEVARYEAGEPGRVINVSHN